LVVEALIPEVEFCTVFPCGFDNIAEAPVAAAYGRFEDALVYVVELEAEEFCAESSFFIED
jgi:hypothetical protein